MKKFLYIFLSIFTASSALANQPKDWQLGFQDPASDGMRDIVNFHNNLLLPIIEIPKPLKEFLNNDMDLIFTDLNTTNTKINLSKLSNKPTCVIVGPEGDFSEEERQEILKFDGVQPIKINENILRSETAVISALSIINYLIN